MLAPKKSILRLGLILGVPLLLYALWTPGTKSSRGKFDHACNCLWLAHGWMADDAWFATLRRAKTGYDSEASRDRLRQTCAENGIAYVFPHLCPTTPAGRLPASDPTRVETLLDTLPRTKVLPWVGGVYGEHCLVESSAWRADFVTACAALLHAHPRLAGLHLNIEPMPDGNRAFLSLLEELKSAIGNDKILSVAAYPPPMWWHPHPDVHWSEAYYREIYERCDQLVPMLYDTALRFEKIYTWLTASWTKELATWTEHAELLVGLPAYKDAGVAYHDPRVENVENALRGVNSALAGLGTRAKRVNGVAIYADWTTNADEWAIFQRDFCREAAPHANARPRP